MAEEEGEISTKPKRTLGASDNVVVCAKKARRFRGFEMLHEFVILEILFLTNRPSVIRLVNRNWERATREYKPMWEQLLSCMQVDTLFLKSTVWINNSEEKHVRNKRSWYIFYFTKDHSILVSHFPYFLNQIDSKVKVQRKLDKIFSRMKRWGINPPCERFEVLPRKDWFIVEEPYPGLLRRTDKDEKSNKVFIGVNPTFQSSFWQPSLEFFEEDSETVHMNPRLYNGEDQGFRERVRIDPRLCKNISAENIPRFKPCLVGGEGLGEADVLVFVGQWSFSQESKGREGNEEDAESECEEGAESEEDGQGF